MSEESDIGHVDLEYRVHRSRESFKRQDSKRIDKLKRGGKLVLRDRYLDQESRKVQTRCHKFGIVAGALLA